MKAHKIVATRDKNEAAQIATFKYDVEGLELSREGIWYSATPALLKVWGNEQEFENCFGFIPEKGSKQTIEIRKAK